MLTELELKRITAAALNQSRADETEVAVFDSDSSLTRFANNEIHQNVSQRDTTLLVKVVFGKKIGVASLNRADEAGARLVIERANDLAHFQVDNPDFQSLPLPVPIAAVAGPSQGTIDFTPEDRAWAVSIILNKALQHGLVAAGAFSTGVSQVAVANSHGVFCHHTNTEAQVSAVMMSSGSPAPPATLPVSHPTPLRWTRRTSPRRWPRRRCGDRTPARWNPASTRWCWRATPLAT